MADGRIVIDTTINSEGAEKDINKLGSTLGSVAKTGLKLVTGAVAAAGVAITGLTKLSIGQYGEYEQLVGGVETLFKSSSDEVIGYANNAYKTAGMSANEYMSTITGFSASLLQGLGGDTKKAAEIGNKAVTDMSDNANKMGTAIGDIQNAYQGFAKQNYTMLDNLKLGYGGTKTEMERLLKDAEKLTGIKYNIENFSDIIEAIHAIQDEMGITGTTALEASETIEGSLNMTKSAWSNLLTGMADDNADFDVLVQNLVDSLGSLGENLLPRIKIAIKGIGELFRTLLPKVLDEIPEMIASLFPESMQEDIKTIFEGIVEAIKNTVNVAMEWLPKIAEGFAWILDNGNTIATIIVSIGTALLVLNVANMIMKLVNAFKGVKTATEAWAVAQRLLNIEMMANPIVLVVGLIAGLVAGIIYLWNTNEDFRNAVIAIWDAIKQFFIDTWNAIVGFFTETIPAWIESMKQWFSDLGAWFGELWESIKQWFIDGWNSIATFFTETIPSWWESIKQMFADGWNAIVSFFTETIPAWLESMFNWFCELPDKIAYGLGFAAVAIKNWVVDSISTFIECCRIIIVEVGNWFQQLPGVIWEWLVNAYNNVVQWASDTWNKFVETCTNIYNSVTEWFSKLPGMIWEWLSQAIDKAVQWGQETYWKMVEAVSNAVNAVIEWFASLPGEIWDWLVSTVNKVIDWGANLAKSGAEAGGKLVEGIIDIVKDLPSKFMEIGVNIVKGIWEGIKSVGSWLHERVSGFFENMLQGARDANEICSPSKLYRDEVGKYIAQGVAVGFDDEADNVQRTMEKDFERMAGKMQMAVDYNMASTTAGIVTRNNNYSNSTDSVEGSANSRKQVIENHIHVDVEGKELAYAMAPHQDVFNDYYKGR
jgi:phage-related protein